MMAVVAVVVVLHRWVDGSDDEGDGGCGGRGSSDVVQRGDGERGGVGGGGHGDDDGGDEVAAREVVMEMWCRGVVVTRWRRRQSVDIGYHPDIQSGEEGLHKGYARFQSLFSQLEIHGAGVSTEDANQKFLRSLPSAWSQVSLIMGTKPGVDSLSFDDLYNNLRVFENDVKGSIALSSSTQNVAFYEQNSSHTCLLIYQVGPQLDHVDLVQLDDRTRRNELGKWQVAMIAIRMKRFTKDEQKNRRKSWKKEEDSKALVTIDGEGVDWTSHSEEDEDYAFDAFFATAQESDTEKKECMLYPTMTGNYMPSGPDIEVDYTQFTYGPKQTQPSESETQTSEFDTCGSNISTKPSELVSEQLSLMNLCRMSNLRSGLMLLSLRSYESDSEMMLLGGMGILLLRPSAGCNWRPQRTQLHKDYPHRALHNKGIVDSGCSRHMTRNKAYLAEYQDFNGGPVAFGGSKGYITGKGKIKHES
ncbi:hypothetical protein Tco_0797069 [Tanacetum coccineum]